MSPDLKQRLTDFYNARIVAGWYGSLAMWIGIFGTLFLPLLDNLPALIDSYFPAVADALRLSPLERILYPVGIAVLIPPARAWLQKGMQVKALKQAVLVGEVSSQQGTEAVLIAVPGVDPVIVEPPRASP